MRWFYILQLLVWVPVGVFFIWDKVTDIRAHFSTKYCADWEPYGWSDEYYGAGFGYARYPLGKNLEGVDNPRNLDYGIPDGEKAREAYRLGNPYYLSPHKDPPDKSNTSEEKSEG